MINKIHYLKFPIKVAFAWKHGAWKVWFRWHGEIYGANYCAWTYHLGVFKICFGHEYGRFIANAFEAGLKTGLSFDGFTREWMRSSRGIK